LEALEINEPAQGERMERRTTTILIRLLGAYHDGHIVFRYSGVKKYMVGSSSCESGHHDWMDDQISVSAKGLLTHHIRWLAEESSWMIEAAAISYEWNPKIG
jgi:hypothetical protein